MIMATNGTALGLAAFAIVGGSWAVYWPKVRQVRVPLRPWGHWIAKVLGVALAIGAFAVGPGILGGTAALLALLLGGMFLFFTLNSAMPDKTPATSVGEPILDFTAQDSGGETFTLSSLGGRPFLLKFFRGHW